MLQKNLLFIIIAIILTAILVGGAVYFWQSASFVKEKQQLEKLVQDLNNQITQLRNQLNKPADPTADWQIYKNNIYEIKYPEDFTMIVTKLEGPIIFDGPKTCPEIYEGYCFDDTLYIEHTYNQGGITAEAWFIEEIDQSGSYNKIGIKEIAGRTAIVAMPKDTEASETRYIFDGGQLLPNKTGQYIIDIRISSGIEDLLKEQILSTFKFIE